LRKQFIFHKKPVLSQKNRTITRVFVYTPNNSYIWDSELKPELLQIISPLI